MLLSTTKSSHNIRWLDRTKVVLDIHEIVETNCALINVYVADNSKNCERHLLTISCRIWLVGALFLS